MCGSTTRERMDAPGITIRSSGSVLPLDAGRAQTREPESGCRSAGGREYGHGRGNRTRVSECSGRSAAVERAGSKNQIEKKRSPVGRRLPLYISSGSLMPQRPRGSARRSSSSNIWKKSMMPCALSVVLGTKRFFPVRESERGFASGSRFRWKYEMQKNFETRS